MIKHSGGASGCESFVPLKIPTADDGGKKGQQQQNENNLSLYLLFPDANKHFETAKAYLSRGALGEAYQCAEKAKQLYSTCNNGGLQHSAVANCYELLAVICEQLSEHNLAIDFTQSALAIYSALDGLDSNKVLICHSLLAKLYSQVGALDLHIAHLKIFAKAVEFVGGSQHPGICAEALGNVYLQLSQYVSRDLAVIAHAYFVKALHIDSGDTLKKAELFTQDAHALAMVEPADKAVEMEKKAHAIYTTVAGPDHQVCLASKERIKMYVGLKLQQDEAIKKMWEEQKKQKSLENGSGNGNGNGNGEKGEGEDGTADKKKKKKKKKRRKKEISL